ncbi:hypothetical protein DL95DRAFT_239676, partial [Leptodontidium sp. 2 PMI_412]
LTKDEISFYQAIRVLSSHGLVEVDTSSQGLVESQGYSIHRCVHSWTVCALNQQWDYDLARLAVRFIESYVLGEQIIRPWLTKRRLLQHAMRCSYMVLNNLVADDKLTNKCNNLGILYYSQDKLVEAEQMYQRALQGYEKALGADNIITYIPALNAIWGLGSLFELQANITEARTMYSKALIGYEKVV